MVLAEILTKILLSAMGFCKCISLQYNLKSNVQETLANIL